LSIILYTLETVSINLHGEPFRVVVAMYPETEVLLKLSPIAMQKALALQFIKEIIDNYFQTPCEAYPGSVKGVNP
jgi:hypothetical protein